MEVNRIFSHEMLCADDMIQEDTTSVSSRGSSNVSFECHSALVFEELSAMLDDEESRNKEEDNTSKQKTMKKQGTLKEDILEKAVNIGSSASALSRTQLPSSEISLDSILEDETISVVRKFEARIIDREVRSGSKLFRSRSAAAFVPTSVAGRVIRSASGTTMRSAGLTRPGTPSVLSNATFGKSSVFPNGSARYRNAKASSVGHSLLSAPVHYTRNKSGNSNKAAKSGTGTSNRNILTTSNRNVLTTSKNLSTPSIRRSAKCFNEVLDSANFLKLMNTKGDLKIDGEHEKTESFTTVTRAATTSQAPSLTASSLSSVASGLDSVSARENDLEHPRMSA